MARPLHLIYQPTVATASFHRDRRMRREPRQKLPVTLAIVSHTQCLAGLPFFVHRHKHGKLLVSVTSDKLFHIAAAPPCARGFARSLRKTPLHRFHSISLKSRSLIEPPCREHSWCPSRSS